MVLYLQATILITTRGLLKVPLINKYMVDMVFYSSLVGLARFLLLGYEIPIPEAISNQEVSNTKLVCWLGCDLSS